MVSKRSEERHIQEAMELGQRNAQIYRQVQNWCRHLNIRLESRGLLAEMSNLPIGMMSIECEHASAGGSMSMHLNQVATDFITRNCRDCPKHELIDIDNIGRKILDQEDEIKERRLAAKASPPVPAKVRLSELVKGDLTAALLREHVTAQSVLELVMLLDDENHAVEAAKKLFAAMQIAPEFFNDDALEVICSHFPEPKHGETCISTIQRLGHKIGKLPPVAFEAAKRCLVMRRNADRACSLIGNYLSQHKITADAELVDRIIDVQWHGRVPGPILGPPPRYYGSNYALKVIGKSDFNLLTEALKTRLRRNLKEVRINTAHVILSLLNEFPQLGLEIADPLIDSLELDDDIYGGESADGMVCRVLAVIYSRQVEAVQQKIADGYKRLSTEAKEELYGVYRFIALGGKAFSDFGQNEADNFDRCIPTIVEPLLQTIAGLSFPIGVKVLATDTLELISKYYPRALVNHLDQILGALANILEEEKLQNERILKTPLEELEKQSREAQYGRVIRDLQKALGALCQMSPRAVWNRLRELVPNLDSKTSHLALYKAHLTTLYGDLGTEHSLLPEVIPDLFKLLMDFDSVVVRGAAVEAAGKILEHDSNALPQNMLEMLIIYLNDTYVYVHKCAARAIRHLRTSNEEEATNIAYRLMILDRAYEKDPYFRQELRQALLRTTRRYPNLLIKMTVPVIIEHGRLEEPMLADDALRDFMYLLEDLPPRCEFYFAREVLTFIGRSERERFNSEEHTDRYRLLLALYDCSKQTIQLNLAAIQTAARAKAKDDPWDALRLAQLLSKFEMHQEASQLAGEIRTMQPTTKRHEWAIREAALTELAAKVEVFASLGQVEAALEALEKASRLEAERHKNEQASHFENFIDTFSVANEIAESLT
jgi:hypothetical protein